VKSFRKNMIRVYDFPPPTPKSHNVLIGSQGVTATNRTHIYTKERNLQK